MNSEYIFMSQRLGFRNWSAKDVETLFEINNDPLVMEFFPSLVNRDNTILFIERMQKQLKDNGFCYFAVDILETRECIGFIGLSEQNYQSSFTPCIDIGWRIKSSAWNKGFATEGAKRCLDFAFADLKLNKVYSIAPLVNEKSIHIMEKIGMRKITEFEHPLLQDNKYLNKCAVYLIQNNS